MEEEDEYFEQFGNTNNRRGKAKSKGPPIGKASGNHLLNFKYEVDRPAQQHHQRRPSYHAPFKKERFMQANYRFMVSGCGDYSRNLKNPDLIVDWDNVEQVTLQTYTEVQCPICLDAFVAPKAGKCGHVFCWACIIRHFSYAPSKQSGNCPICFAHILLNDLKSAVTETATQYREGISVRFTFMKRSKQSMIALPRSQWSLAAESRPTKSSGAPFCRFTIAMTADMYEILDRETSELEKAMKQAISEQDDSLPFIAMAQEQLEERKKSHSFTSMLAEVLLFKNDQPMPVQSKPTSNTPITVVAADSTSTDTYSESEESVDHWEGLGLYEEPREQSVQQSGSARTPETEAPVSDIKRGSNVSDIKYQEADQAPRKEQMGNGNGNHHLADFEDDGFYYFYQASDGQLIFLNDMNVKILLKQFGSIEQLPDEIQGEVLELEDFTQSEKFRKRFRSLSHVPFSASFFFAEIDMRRLVSREATRPFMDIIMGRNKRRRSQKRREKEERDREEALQAATRIRVNRINIESEEHFPGMLTPEMEAAIQAAEMEQRWLAENFGNNQPNGSSESSTSSSFGSGSSPSAIGTSPARSFAAATSGAMQPSPVRGVWSTGGTQAAVNGTSPPTGTTSFKDSFAEALKAPKQSTIVIPKNAPVKSSKGGKQYLVLSNNHQRRKN